MKLILYVQPNCEPCTILKNYLETESILQYFEIKDVTLKRDIALEAKGHGIKNTPGMIGIAEDGKVTKLSRLNVLAFVDKHF